jgi:hypothetical protein
VGLFDNTEQEEERESLFTPVRKGYRAPKEEPYAPKKTQHKAARGLIDKNTRITSKKTSPAAGDIDIFNTGRTPSFKFKPDPVARPHKDAPQLRRATSRLPDGAPQSLGAKTLDFLFGPEAAVIGIAHDAAGWSWNVENMKQQWSEEPLWSNALATASLVGTMVLPASLALTKSAKVGRLATKMGRWGTEAEEIANWKKIGVLGDQNITKFSQLGPDYEKTVTLLRQQQIATNRFRDMEERARKIVMKEPVKPWEAMRHQFDKRFSQTYNGMVTNANNGDIKGKFHEMHNKLWQNDTVGTILREMPDEKEGEAIYGYILGQIAPGMGIAAKAAGKYGKLSEKSQKWADFYLEAARKRQDEMLQSGFITQKQYMRIGDAHLPGLYKGTPDYGIGATTLHYVPVKPKLGKPQAAGLVATKVPRKGLGRLFGKEKTVLVPEGEVRHVGVQFANKPQMNSPTMLPRKGSHEDMWDRLESGQLITNPADLTMKGYMQDGILHSNFQFITDYAVRAENIAPAELVKAAGMSKKKMEAAGFTSLEEAGSGAAAVLRRMIAKKKGVDEEQLPWIRKEVFKGIFGEDGMMHQAEHASGNLMDVMTTIYKTMKTAGSIPTHLQNLTGNMTFLHQAGFNVLKPENMALMGQMTSVFNKVAQINAAAKGAGIRGRSIFDDKLLKGVKMDAVVVDGKKFDMLDEMSDPVVRELIEESAFESVEGTGKLGKMLETLGEDQSTTKGAIKGYMKVKEWAQIGDRVKWFDGLTRAYLAEDMVPKMAYFMKLRGSGLSRKAAATEVARRLPMYNTVGSAIKKGRRFAFPWATFPAEAMRITKNNIQDHPLRMIPWLRAPQIMQSVFSGMGYAPSTREEVGETKAQLPFWAQGHTTVVGEGGMIGTLGAAGTGGLIGAAAGAAIGKSGGAAGVGAAVGGGISGILSSIMTDEAHASEMRGAMMDFLPHSTFLQTTTAEEYYGKIAPAKDIQGLLEQMPAEPLAILKPMISAFSGETPYGQPVGDGTLGGGINKTIAGMLGFLAPPLLQKYGFKLTTPDVALWGDTGMTNISKLLIDTGNAIDPMTGRPGSMTHDFLMNNAGVFKSYAASGEQQLANEQLTERHMGKVRKHLTKNLDYHLDMKDDEEVVDILTRIQGSFAEQYGHDPRIAQNKYTEWLVRHAKQLGRHPKLKGWSEEEIIDRLQRAGKLGADARSRARNTLIQALRDELTVRRRAKGG